VPARTHSIWGRGVKEGTSLSEGGGGAFCTETRKVYRVSTRLEVEMSMKGGGKEVGWQQRLLLWAKGVNW